MADNQQWEYKSISLGGFWTAPKDEQVEETLNALGLEGWEVVNMFTHSSTNQFRALLKRPLTADAAARRRRQNWPGNV